MVAITNRAVLQQRIRLKRELLSGIEQRSIWNNEVLEAARERLDLSSIDMAQVDSQITEFANQERSFQRELLQIEAELGPNGDTDHLNSQGLMAVNKLILYSRAQTQVIVGNAKKGLLALSED